MTLPRSRTPHSRRYTFVLLTLALTAVAALPRPVTAQDALQPGARVRIEGASLPGDRLVGTVLSRSADSIEIALTGSVRSRIPLSAIDRLEISQGPSRRAGAVRGMKIGLVIGGVSGAIVAVSILGASEYECGGSCEGLAAGFLAVALLESAGLGAGIGAIVRAESWRRMPAPRLALLPGQRGVRVQLGRIAFGN